jgi:2'-5' RNA ligase
MALKKYFIAIVPPEPLLGDINLLKKEVSEKYNNKSALRSPPHITLHLPFEWKSEKEEKLVETLRQFKFGHHLEIALNGFSCFEPKVVFIDVEKNELLDRFQKNLVTHIKEHLHIFNQANDTRAYHPHITIAFRDLRKADFFAMMEEYKHKQYAASFNCSSFCLLEHTGKIWQIKTVFLFS